MQSRLRRGASAAAVAVAWLSILASAVICLQQVGGSLTEVLAYLAAWLIGSTLPGVLMWRALAGHSTIVRELRFGSVLGIVLQLLAWALATSVHRPRLMIILPVGVVVVFVLWPGLRRHWWPSRTGPMRTPARWHVVMAVVIALAVYRLYTVTLVRRALPPETRLVNRDTWYNSAISYELSRTIRPQDPFAVG